MMVKNKILKTPSCRKKTALTTGTSPRGKHYRSAAIIFYLITLFTTVANADPGAWTLRGPFESNVDGSDAKWGDLSSIRRKADTSDLSSLGNFDYECDAWAVKYRLERSSNVKFTVEKSPDQDKSATPLNDITLLSYPVFRVEVERADELPTQTLHDDERYRQLEALDTPQTRQEYKTSLLKSYEAVTKDDPLSGYISVNLGILAIIDKNYDESLTYFLPVANGDLSSCASHRVMAMSRAAWVMHWKKERLDAYIAYREIEKFTNSDQVRFKCQVESIGLMIELAESGKGNFEDVQTAILIALLQIPIEEVGFRSTIELMEMETFARRDIPDYAEAARRGEEFIKKYSQLKNAPQRELSAAVFQTGFFYLNMGKNDEAKRCFEKVLNDFPENTPQFFGVNAKAQALNGLSVLSIRAGDNETSEKILRDIIELYPSTNLSKGIRAAIPDLETRIQATEIRSPRNTEP